MKRHKLQVGMWVQVYRWSRYATQAKTHNCNELRTIGVVVALSGETAAYVATEKDRYRDRQLHSEVFLSPFKPTKKQWQQYLLARMQA